MGRKRCLRQLQEEPELQFPLSEQHCSGFCQGHPPFPHDIYGPPEQNHIKHRVSGYLIPLRCKLSIAVLNKRKGVKSLATGSTGFESTRSQHEAISSVVLDHWWNPPPNPEMHFVAGSDCCHRPNQHLKSKQPQTEEAEVRQLWLGFMSACYQVKGFPLKNRVLMIKWQARGKQEKKHQDNIWKQYW